MWCRHEWIQEDYIPWGESKDKGKKILGVPQKKRNFRGNKMSNGKLGIVTLPHVMENSLPIPCEFLVLPTKTFVNKNL